MKDLSTLIQDVEQLLVDGVEDIPEDKLETFSKNLIGTLQESLLKRKREPTLRMSNIGKPCERQLWYELNHPDLSEELRPENYMKFMYGHLVEELLLFLVELAGHEVTGRQDELEIEGIKGHRDAIIDGYLVDAKSASSFSFKKFKSGQLAENDAFGYIPQINSYLHASQEDDKVKIKDRSAFLVVDKTLGHITLDIHTKDSTDWNQVYKHKKEMIKGPCPERGFEAVPFGQSGNLTLGTNCSYCPFKKTCWPELRTFLYANKPVDLVKVVREPKVPELGREANIAVALLGKESEANNSQEKETSTS